MKKIYIYIFVAVFLLLSIGIPLFIDWIIIGNKFPSNIHNSDWVAFLGGYIGAILGALFSLIGIAWTIKFTREQNRSDRELQIRPYFDIRYLNVEQFCHTKSWLGYVMVEIWDNDENNIQADLNATGSGLLYLKNVGNGPATNINFQVYTNDIECKHQAYYTNQNTMVTTNSILPGEKAELSIDINNSRLAPRKDDFTWDETSPFPTNIANCKIPDKFSIKLILEYSDLMSNRFSQELYFDVNYSLSYKKEEDGKYHCELNLSKIESPHINKRKK